MNLRFPFILFITFDGIGSIDIDLLNTQPKYVTCACCFILISLYLIVGLQIFLALSFYANRIDLTLSFPNLLCYLQTSHKYLKKPSLSIFSISVISLCLYIRHESSACTRKFDFSAWSISLKQIEKRRGHRMEAWEGLQEIFLKWHSLFSVSTKNIPSQK